MKQTTVGIFKIHDVEYEGERVQSRQLRHLKERLLAHLKTQSHEKMVQKEKEKLRIQSKLVTRNQQIGRTIGSLAYFFFYHKLPYLLFEQILPMLSLNSIDIGQINHTDFSSEAS